MSQIIDSLIEQCAHLHPNEIDLGLDRMHRLLAAMGNPERRIPPVIHVAGTNGKGSTLAFLGSLLTQNNQTYHKFTSPHLVNFNERITICGKPAPEADIIQALEKTLQINNGAPLTPFELITCAAFELFGAEFSDFTLMEVGLGGRLDATNVFDNPVVTAITSIGFDHMDQLGNTLAEIAFEKAGIIKPGVPVVVPSNLPYEAMEVIQRIASERNAPLMIAEPYVGPLALEGTHQRYNAGIAVMIANVLGMPFTESSKAALSQTCWPGRFETLQLSLEKSIIVDGAHNVDGMRVLPDTLMEKFPDQKIIFLIHIKARKDVQRMLAMIAPIAHSVYVMDDQIPGGDAVPFAEITKILAPYNIPCHRLSSIDDITTICGARSEPVVAAGSLFWVGALLARFGNQNKLR